VLCKGVHDVVAGGKRRVQTVLVGEMLKLLARVIAPVIKNLCVPVKKKGKFEDL
jgi:hypothetical protein